MKKIKTLRLEPSAYLHTLTNGEEVEVLISMSHEVSDQEMCDRAPSLSAHALRTGAKTLKKLAKKLEKKAADDWFAKTLSETQRPA